VPRPLSLRQLRLRLISLLDQKVGREKSVLRRNIAALDRLIRAKEGKKEGAKVRTEEDEKSPEGGYPDNQYDSCSK